MEWMCAFLECMSKNMALIAPLQTQGRFPLLSGGVFQHATLQQIEVLCVLENLCALELGLNLIIHA